MPALVQCLSLQQLHSFRWPFAYATRPAYFSQSDRQQEFQIFKQIKL